MLIIKSLPLLLAISAARAASIPHKDDSADAVHLSSPFIREKRSPFPGRAMMFHGYFGSGGHPYHNPVTLHHGYERHNGRSYDPQRAMTAFAAGDTVSAGPSFYGGGGGPHCRNCNGAKKPSNGNGHPTNGNGFNQHKVLSRTPAANYKPDNGNGQQKPNEEEQVGYPNDKGNGADNEGYLGDQPAGEETLPPATPTRPATTEGPKKRPAAEESEEDEEEEEEPPFFSRGKGRGPSYNSYFPMVFGAYPGFGIGRGGNREDENAHNPGVATAIANSFSTGRGAVATSHATAYGGPHFIPPSYRNNGSRRRPH